MVQETTVQKAPTQEVSAQVALRHGPGRFRALYTFNPREESVEGRRQLVKAAATLLKEMEQECLVNKPLQILVAVSWDLLTGHEAQAELRRDYVDVHAGREQAAVLVQVAAETEDERTYAGRLIRRVLKGSAQLKQEFFGGRHTLNQEPFGYREAQPGQEKPVVPVSESAPGVSWLLYQQCVQRLDAFYDLPEKTQDEVIGLTRNPDPNKPYPTGSGSHVAVARAPSETGRRSQLLRRSFGYETYEEAGLLFLATAKTAPDLKAALDRLERDRLKEYLELRAGGLYVVPPNSNWLCSDQLNVLGEQRPLREAVFYPKFSLLLYEVTPKTLEFFHRVFHAHKDHFDEGGKLRSDLKLLTKGLAKLLYGGAIHEGSALYQLLHSAFEADSSASIVRDIEDPPSPSTRAVGAPAVPRDFRKRLENLSRRCRDHEFERRAAFRRDRNSAAIKKLDDEFARNVKAERDTLRPLLADSTRLSRVLGSTDWTKRTAAELFGEMVVKDAETMSGRDPAELGDLNTLIQLCEDAAAEAREINESVGYYMTFMC